MSKLARTRLVVAAALMAALSVTTVGATAVGADAGSSVVAKRSGDLWCC